MANPDMTGEQLTFAQGYRKPQTSAEAAARAVRCSGVTVHHVDVGAELDAEASWATRGGLFNPDDMPSAPVIPMSSKHDELLDRLTGPCQVASLE